MRKGGTAVSRLVITVPTRELGNGVTTETGAILTVKVTQAARDILTTVVRQELMKIDQATPTVMDITTHTVVISLNFANCDETRSVSNSEISLKEIQISPR